MGNTKNWNHENWINFVVKAYFYMNELIVH
jgi:hypothetical protein